MTPSKVTGRLDTFIADCEINDAINFLDAVNENDMPKYTAVDPEFINKLYQARNILNIGAQDYQSTMTQKNITVSDLSEKMKDRYEKLFTAKAGIDALIGTHGPFYSPTAWYCYLTK